jgi:ABC-type glycerol-3-phosphate transport system substrate-binding protein
MKTHVHGISALLGAAITLALGALGCDNPAAAQDPAPSAGPASPSAAPAPVATPPARAVEISMLYSSEKKEWIEAAAADFRKEHPDIKLTLTAMGSLDAAQALVDGKEKPTMWSPADSLVENLVASEWKATGKPDLFAASGGDAPQPLVITPLVFVAWEDRAAALLKAAGGSVGWKTIHAGITANEGWPAIGGKPTWGFVKLGHADPARSNSGLQALYSMTLDFYGRPGGLEVADLLRPGYQKYVREIEKGVPRLEASTTAFMTDMLRFGPSKYDVAVVYESTALAQIATAEGRWGKLKLYYPATTLWSDHPVAVLHAEWVTEPQRVAARAFIAYLKSRPAQEMALSYGFRPADPSVAIKGGDAQNPFTKNADRGVKLDIPAMAPAPSGEVVRAMLTMWSRVVAK